MFDVSFAEAASLIRRHLFPRPPVSLPVWEAEGFVLAEPVEALFDVPAQDVSLKDGFAVRAEDVARASPEEPVPLRLKGAVFAGEEARLRVGPGEAVRVTSGALLPSGADAVLAEEFAVVEGERVLALADAHPGRNVLSRGEDLRAGSLLLSAGTRLWPPDVGLLAAAGHTSVRVYPRPRVLVLATGDEIVPVGAPVTKGKVVASNLVTIYAWLKRFGLSVATEIVPDRKDALRETIERLFPSFDALVTSGGAWKGERDLIVRVLDDLGWQKVFHRLRLGPGKALAFGLLDHRPVFCLPGGPPSNQAAFLLLALPGLLRLAGEEEPFPTLPALLAQEVCGEVSWTQVFFGRLKRCGSRLVFFPEKPKSRLQYLSSAEALLLLPEGEGRIPPGAEVSVKIIKDEVLKAHAHHLP